MKALSPTPPASAASGPRRTGVSLKPAWPATLLIILLALLCVAGGPPVLVSGHSAFPLRFTGGQIAAMAAEQAGPPVQAAAAALVDRPSNATLFARNASTPLPMASVTKLMTVMEALESLAPDQVVTVPAAALVGGASMGLQAGEQVDVLTLLYGALLPSGNDAATTLALAAEGSEAGFVARMNEQAAAWGLSQTHFANPTGLDAPGHASSALDLAALGRQALANPLVSGIVAQPSANIGGYSLQNTNELLGVYDGAYGVKTGTTDAAGQVLIAAAKRSTGDALAVVMNSPDRFAEARRLLDFYFQHWLWQDAGLSRDVLNRVTAPDGTVYALRTPPQPLFLDRWQASQLRTFRRVSFDEANQPSGVYQVWMGDQLLLETPIQFIQQPSAIGND